MNNDTDLSGDNWLYQGIKGFLILLILLLLLICLLNVFPAGSWKEIITVISSVFALWFGVLNLWLLRRAEKYKQDETIFNTTTSNLGEAIRGIETVGDALQNDSFTWNVLAEQLSAFHNIAITIRDFRLRVCYCAKLFSFMLRIRNVLDKVDDYRFFYGVKNYKEKTPEMLLLEARRELSYISVNSLNCLVYFLTLFHGAKGNFMYDESEHDRILQPIYCGCKEDEKEPTLEQIQKMGSPFKNIFTYIHEWREGIQKLHGSKDDPLFKDR